VGDVVVRAQRGGAVAVHVGALTGNDRILGRFGQRVAADDRETLAAGIGTGDLLREGRGDGEGGHDGQGQLTKVLHGEISCYWFIDRALGEALPLKAPPP